MSTPAFRHLATVIDVALTKGYGRGAASLEETVACENKIGFLCKLKLHIAASAESAASSFRTGREGGQ
jgi:hypothetical protein